MSKDPKGGEVNCLRLFCTERTADEKTLMWGCAGRAVSSGGRPRGWSHTWQVESNRT